MIHQTSANLEREEDIKSKREIEGERVRDSESMRDRLSEMKKIRREINTNIEKEK